MFVHDGCITAVSYCIFPNLGRGIDEEQFLDEIITYWSSVRGSVSAHSYIMDLVKLTTEGTWKIIELNPFATTTGGGLFD